MIEAQNSSKHASDPCHPSSQIIRRTDRQGVGGRDAFYKSIRSQANKFISLLEILLSMSPSTIPTALAGKKYLQLAIQITAPVANALPK